MKQFFALVLFSFWVLNTLFAQNSSLPKSLLVHFETASDQLGADQKLALDIVFGPLISRKDKLRVTISGHTDSRGSADFNRSLSLRRGAAVAAFLKGRGLAAERIQVFAIGEKKPFDDNRTDEGKAQNRRVEVIFEEETAADSWMQTNSVPMATLHFQAEKGLEFESPRSGTTVSVPPGALVRADGSPVFGQVDFQFREYRGPEDFLAAGIPMHYEDGRGDWFFNSAGMVEMRAFQKNEALFVATGQAVTVDFVATDQLAGASLYLFDDQKNAWEFAPNDAFNPLKNAQKGAAKFTAATLPDPVSEADVRRDNIGQNDWDDGSCRLPGLPSPFENSTAVGWFMASVKTGAELAAGRQKLPGWFKKFPTQTNQFYLMSLDKGDIRLRSSLTGEFFPEDLSGTFSELDAFKNHFFEADSIEYLLRMTPSGLMSDLRFQAVTVAWLGGDGCEFSLTLGDEILKVNAHLKMSPEYAHTRLTDDFAEVRASYDRQRTERVGEISTRIEGLRRFLDMAPVLMSGPEFCSGSSEWLHFFEKNGPKMQIRYDSAIAVGLGSDREKAELALRFYGEKWKIADENFQKRLRKINQKNQDLTTTLSLQKFGIYNCDQIFRLEQQPEMIVAAFQTAAGRTIKPLTISILERDSRMFFSMGANRENRFYKMPGRRLDVVVAGSDGRIYHLPADDYAKLDFGSGPDFLFRVSDITERVKSPKEWASLLGI